MTIRKPGGTALVAVLVLGGAAAVQGQGSVIEGHAYRAARPAANVVVYLEPVDDDYPVSRQDTVVIDQLNLRFLPTTVAITPGTTVAFRNSDPVMHNVFGPGPGAQAFDLGTYPLGAVRHHTFTEPGVHVVLCHVHPEMASYVVVISSRLNAVTGREGEFSIPEVAPGRYRLLTWHRHRGFAIERTIQVPGPDSEDLRVVLDGSPRQRPAR